MRDSIIMYAGTYTNGESQGIYRLRIDPETGRITDPEVAAVMDNPSYFAISKDALYTVAETDQFQHARGGAVASFRLDPATGSLMNINVQPSGGCAPCHICTDQLGRYVFAANYRDGTVSMYPICPDGSIGKVLCVRKHTGSGPVKGRQEAAHAHFVTLTPDEKYLVAVDLGADMLFVYEVDIHNGDLIHREDLSVKVASGSGPRHMAFHASGKIAYLVNELSSDIVVYHYQAGVFQQVQRISALPADYTGESTCAAIHLSKDSRFLYVSNRGHDSIAVFAIDPATGQLVFVEHASSEGSHPRDFTMDPSGSHLYIANQKSNRIVCKKIDQETGKLTPTNIAVELPSPVCLKIIECGV